MKVDLSKPIRLILDHEALAQYVGETPDKRAVIAHYESQGDKWYAYAYAANEVDAFFENIPPAPRKCKTWVVWDYGSIGSFPVGAATVQIFKDAGARVTEHEIEEPAP